MAPGTTSRDVYSFLGLEQHFRSALLHSSHEKLDIVRVDFSDDIIKRNNIVTCNNLQEFVKNIVSEAVGNSNSALIKFQLVGSRHFFSLIFNHPSCQCHELNLRSIYFHERLKCPWRSHFRNTELKIVVHIRQGDTSLIETPWKTYIPLWPRRISLMEYSNKQDIPSNDLIDTGHFAHYLSLLTAALSRYQVSMLIFSDGYERAFKILSESEGSMGLTPARREQLMASKAKYSANKFKIFDSMPQCRLLVGERADYLYDLIHSTLTSDIIIVGTQQKMLLKLIAAYCNSSDMPLVIVLHSKTVATTDVDDYHRFGLERHKFNIMHTSFMDACNGRIIDRLLQLAEKRSRAGH